MVRSVLVTTDGQMHMTVATCARSMAVRYSTAPTARSAAVHAVGSGVTLSTTRQLAEMLLSLNNLRTYSSRIPAAAGEAEDEALQAV